MALYTSVRERRLWLWTLALMVAIYSTLGLAREVAELLREHNLLRITFGAVVLVIAGGVVWGWVKRRPDWAEVGVALGVVAAYLMIGVRMGSWEERTHLIEYGIVAALIHQALLERVRNGASVWKPALLTIILTTLLGLLDESIQFFLPERVFSWADVFFNFFAGFMVVAARLAIVKQKGPGWRIWFLLLMAASIGWGNGVYWGWYTPDEPKTLQDLPDLMLAGYLGMVSGALFMGVLQALVLRKQIERIIWWVPASIAALAVSGALIFGIGIADEPLGWYVGVSAFGTVVGFFQWLVMRGQIPLAGWWILASTIGWGLGMPFGDLNGPPGLGAVYGLLTASAMVWLLRQEDLARPANPELPVQ